MDEELLELLGRLLGQASGTTPVRRTLRLHVTMDDRGRPTVEIVGGETFRLSSEGSLDAVEISLDRIYSGCRCTTNSEVGGRCSLCNRSVCTACWSRCALCLTGLCPGCLIRIPTKSGYKDLCPSCEDDVRWKSLVSRTTLGLLPPARF